MGTALCHQKGEGLRGVSGRFNRDWLVCKSQQLIDNRCIHSSYTGRRTVQCPAAGDRTTSIYCGQTIHSGQFSPAVRYNVCIWPHALFRGVTNAQCPLPRMSLKHQVYMDHTSSRLHGQNHQQAVNKWALMKERSPWRLPMIWPQFKHYTNGSCCPCCEPRLLHISTPGAPTAPTAGQQAHGKLQCTNRHTHTHSVLMATLSI